jgi:hypothetical protein
MTLRVYRRLSSAMVPLSPALISRRLKAGKEDPARVGERRGLSADIRPSGPLVWIHGASVGEVLAAAALIERSLQELAQRVDTAPRLWLTGGGAPALVPWLPEHELVPGLVLEGLQHWAQTRRMQEVSS